MLRIELGDRHIISREAVREPHLFKLRSGELLLSYHVQPDIHFAERHMMRSCDGGATWKPDARRAHREQVYGENDQGVVLAFDMYTFERRPGEYVGSFYRSTDGGRTFTGPHMSRVFVNGVCAQPYPTPEHFPDDNHPLRKFFQPLPKYYTPIVADTSLLRGPMFWRYIVYQGNRWLTVMYGYFHGDRVRRAILVASEDQGQTWHYQATVAYDHEEAREGFSEPALSVLPDDSLLCILRRGGMLPLAQFRSYDGGATWTPAELLPGYGVDPDLHLMSNGVLACTYGRPGRYIMFSEDGHGLSWGYRTPIG